MENETQPQEAEILDETLAEETQADQGEEQTKAELAKYKAIAERKTRQLEEAKKGKEASPPAQNIDANEKIAELEFKLENPDLRDSLDLLKTFAKGKGITLQEASKDEQILSILSIQKEKAGVSVINSNNKITAHASETAKKRQEMMSKGTTEALADYLTETGVE